MKFEVVVQQWLPQSCQWKECVVAIHDNYATAYDSANNLQDINRQAYVRNVEDPKPEEKS